MRAGADHVAVRQEALVGVGIDLLGHPLLDEAGLPELLGEALGQLVVLRRGRAAEVVPGEAELAAEVMLHLVLLGAEGGGVLALLGGGELGGVPCSSVAQI